jgi:hypothetical protein
MASLTYEAKQMDARAADENGQMTAEYSFTNTGKTPVTIRSIQTSCGCTTATSDKPSYNPGEKGTIKAIYKPGAAGSPSQKVILVQTDDPADPVDQLLLRVATPGSATLDPSALFWNHNEEPKAKVIKIHIKDGTVTVIGLSSPTSDFLPTLKTITPNAEYEISVLPKTTAQPKTATLLIETSLPGMKKNIAVIIAVRAGQ